MATSLQIPLLYSISFPLFFHSYYFVCYSVVVAAAVTQIAHLDERRYSIGNKPLKVNPELRRYT